MFREASIGRHYEDAPQVEGEGFASWVTRGANFVVVYTRGEPGAVVQGTGRDEQFAYALEGGVEISVGGAREALGAEDLSIVPPGAWTLAFRRAGQVVQLLTADEDIAARAWNAATYADGAPEVAKPGPWPEPVGGYRLRRHSTLEAYARGSLVNAYRTRRLMMVPYPRFLEPRDETALSPHSHADFEQGSVALEGGWLHHLRVPWTTNRREWRPDLHLEVGSPSTTIIPAGIIHTSQGTSGEGMRLIDVFAPPRLDFSQRGFVVNAADYPMPEAVA
jgi:mannose-6-phosphate isomerase-like protein (cupin superfamily)